MKTITRKYKLQDFYSPSKNYIHTKGDAYYNGSLTPTWRLLKNIREIRFQVSYINPYSNFLTEKRHQNPVNSHIFKPRYYDANSKHALLCHVATSDVLLHTLRALAKVSFYLKTKNNLNLQINSNSNGYQSLSKNWKIHDRIIFSRTESFLNFIRLFWLLENKRINVNQFRIISVGLEQNRLKPVDLKKHSILFQLANRKMSIQSQKTESRVVKSHNLIFRKMPITAVQLPWGAHMAREVIDSVLDINPNIKKVALVGGVGYVGKDKLKIDDIFIPTALTQGNDQKGYRQDEIINNQITKRKNSIFNNKKISRGSIYTVIPKKRIMSNSNPVTHNNGKIDAFDMELAGFLSSGKLNSKIKLNAIYYVMDFPKLGLGLGNTYYNLDFLTNLFANPNRGKHFAMERAIKFLTK